MRRRVVKKRRDGREDGRGRGMAAARPSPRPTPHAGVVAGFALVVALLSAGDRIAAGSDADRLERDLRWIATGQFGYGADDIGIVVLDESGAVRASVGGETPLKPASTLKILTTAAGLYLLGPEYEYRTALLSTAPIAEGRITGDLILRGTGDPNISGRFYDGDVTHLLKRWARDLRGAGLVEVSGDLVVDDSLFDDERFLPGWNPADAGRWFSAQISPLSLNDNCVDVYIVPAARPGVSASVRIVPQSSAIQSSGRIRTVGGSVRAAVLHRRPGTSEIAASGRVGVRVKNYYDHVTIEDPAMFFGTTLRDVLRRHGVHLRGRVRRARGTERRYAPGWHTENGDAAPPPISAPGEVVLITHASPLRLDLPVINKNSQNLHAEILLKTLGAVLFGDGSVEGGERAIRRYLSERGIANDGLAVRDGSGLSHESRVSALTLARALSAALRGKHGTLYRRSLAVAGVDGTLDDRFRRYPELRKRVAGKTGSIRGVSNLAGCVDAAGRTWTFVVLVNGRPKRAKSPRDLHERIVDETARAMRRLGDPR